jgi:hypothetical protein
MKKTVYGLPHALPAACLIYSLNKKDFFGLPSAVIKKMRPPRGGRIG